MGGHAHDDESLISGINVTPLVDVVLVLLVVLMVTAGWVVCRALPIETPSAHGAPATDATFEIVVDATGHASVDGEVMDTEALRAVAATYAARTAIDGRRAIVSADRRAAHGDVVDVLDLVRGAQIAHVGVRVRPTP